MLICSQYISWISDGQLVWTVLSSGLVADSVSQISARPVPQEPMVTTVPYDLLTKLTFCQYLIMNLGISPNFGKIDFTQLTFPTTMRVDWIRVYQPQNSINYGCDPADFPTEAYITQ